MTAVNLIYINFNWPQWASGWSARSAISRVPWRPSRGPGLVPGAFPQRWRAFRRTGAEAALQLMRFALITA